MPVASAKRAQRRRWPRSRCTPPPATISGRCAPRMTAAARSSAAGSGTGRAMCHTRLAKSSSRPVVRLGLHVLRQGDGHRAGLGRVGEHPHRAEQRARAAARAARPGRRTSTAARNASLTRDVVRRRAASSSCSTGAGDAGGEDVARAAAAPGCRLMVASAAPVSMLVEPGPIDAVQAKVAAGCASGRSRRRRAPCPARCGPGGRAVGLAGRRRPAAGPGRRRRRCRGRRCPNSRRSAAAPRRRARCTGWPGTRTSAWATVSRRSSHRLVPPSVVNGQPGVDLLVLPGAADPGVGRVVADQPGPLVPGPGHDVEVVEVVAGRGHRRAVPAVRDEHGVAAAHLGAARRSRGRARVP